MAPVELPGKLFHRCSQAIEIEYFFYTHHFFWIGMNLFTANHVPEWRTIQKPSFCTLRGIPKLFKRLVNQLSDGLVEGFVNLPFYCNRY